MFMSKSMNLKINEVHQKITTRPNLQDYKQKRPKAYPSNPPVEKHWFRAYFSTGGSRLSRDPLIGRDYLLWVAKTRHFIA